MPYCPECSASVPEGVEQCPTCGSSIIATPTDAEGAAEQPALHTEELQQELAQSIAPQYEVIKLLGTGGMGAVFLAREPALKRLVAVKILAPHLAADSRARTRFEREARAAAALSHPNVVRVYAVGETKNDKLPYMIMQYVQGPTLAEWLMERGKASERDARRVIGEVAAALAAAHTRDLVHRDVKPSNVLLETESGRAFVADFGVSAAISPQQQIEQTKLTATGTVVGTPIYMSPEQAAGEQVTPKSDVYSLGMLAYELLTGQLPFSATSAMGWVAAHMRDRPMPVTERRAELSPEVAKLVDRCLAKDPAERPDATEIARGMLPSIETEIEWPPPGLADMVGRVKTLLRLLALTGMAGILLVMFVKITPDILQAHPNWLARFEIPEDVEGALAGARTSPVEGGQVSFFLWQTALILGSVIFGLGFLGSANVVLRLGTRLRSYRRLGWKWPTLMEVAGDHDGRSGLIMVGAREFASLDAQQRTLILRTRRTRAILLLGAYAWFILAVVMWMALVTSGFASRASPGPLAGTAAWLLVLVPGTALLVGAALAARRERRLLGPLAEKRSYEGSEAEVAEWYSAAPGSHEPQPTRPTRGLRRLLRPVAIGLTALLVIIVMIAAAEVLAASLVAARFVQANGPRTAELVAALNRLAAEDPLGTARPVWQEYLPQPVPIADSTSRALIVALASLERSGSLPLYEPADVRLFPNDSLHALALQRAMRRQLAADTLRMLESLAAHPRTEAFRQLALADSMSVFEAVLEYPLADYGNFTLIPVARPAPLRQAAAANRLAALLEIARGDRSAALVRLGENAAFAEHMLSEPVYLYNLVGMRTLQRDVLAPLAALADAEGDRAAAAGFRDAREQLEGLRVRVRGVAGLATDPEHMEQYSQALLRYPILTGFRAELTIAGWAGLCANPSEILNGPSAARRRAMLALADSAPLPYGRTLSLLIARSWETPLGALMTGDEFSDLGLWEKTPLATAFRLLRCIVETW